MTGALFLFAGLAFFIFGINRLNYLLAKIAGGSLQEKIVNLTKNDFVKLLSGVGITALFQSSNATTVILVSMTGAGFITVLESTGFILGANIASVTTAWIVAFKISEIAIPIFTVGVLGDFFIKKKNLKRFFVFLTGIGLIFYGLTMMSDSVAFISKSKFAMYLMSEFNAEVSIPALLLLTVFGVLFTAIIQSSAATTVMIMSLAATGFINLHSSAAIVLGSTLGATITAFLAAMNGTVDGKRVAFIHVFINIIGLIIGLLVFYPSVTFTAFIANLIKENNVAFTIVLYLTIVKIVTVIILFPLRNMITSLVTKIIKDKYETLNIRMEIPKLPFGASSLMIKTKLSDCMDVMMKHIQQMLFFSYKYLFDAKEASVVQIIERYENFIDSSHKKLVKAISESENSNNEVLWLFLKMSDEVESMADHIKEIAKYATRMHEVGFTISVAYRNVLKEAEELVYSLFKQVCVKMNYSEELVKQADIIERTIRAHKREVFSSLTSCVTDRYEEILHITDILSEYSKINHSIKRILQVNLDNIEGRGIFIWKAPTALPENKETVNENKGSITSS